MIRDRLADSNSFEYELPIRAFNCESYRKRYAVLPSVWENSLEEIQKTPTAKSA
jgi:hypothetical protein